MKYAKTANLDDQNSEWLTILRPGSLYVCIRCEKLRGSLISMSQDLNFCNYFSINVFIPLELSKCPSVMKVSPLISADRMLSILSKKKITISIYLWRPCRYAICMYFSCWTLQYSTLWATLLLPVSSLAALREAFNKKNILFMEFSIRVLYML